MVKIVFFLIIFFLPCFIFSQSQENNEFNNLFLQLEKLVPREEGTLNEEKTIIFLDQFAKFMNLKIKVTSLNPITEDAFSRSKNIEFFIKGLTKNEILYLIPLNQTNTMFYPMLLLIKELTKRQKFLQISARFVFLGAEYGDAPFYPMGSKSLLYTYNSSPKTLFFYLDITHPSQHIKLFSLNEKMPHLWAIKEAKKILKNAHLKPFYPHFSLAIDTLYESPKKTSILSLYEREHLQGIYLTNKNSAKNSFNNTDLYTWSKNLTNAFSEWHLSLNSNDFQLRNLDPSQYIVIATLLISEKIYIITLLILFIIALTILYSRLQFIPKLLKKIPQYLKNITLFLSFIFIANFLSGLIILSFLLLIGNTELCKQQPLLFFIYKIIGTFIITIFLCTIFIPESRLYKSGLNLNVSLIGALIAFFILLMIKIFASYPILWMILCLSTASCFTIKIARTFFIYLSPILLILNLFYLFTDSYNNSTQQFFLFNNILANIFLTFLIAPLFYAFKELGKKNTNHHNLKLKKIVSIVLFLWMISIPSFALLILKLSKNSQPLEISIIENLNLSYTKILLESPQKIGSFNLLWKQKVYPISNAAKKTIIETPTQNNLDIATRIYHLENRNILEIKIMYSQNINFYDIEIKNHKDLLMINSNYPWISHKSNSEKTGQFSILTGKNPENPLIITITCNKVQETHIKVTGTIFNTQNIQALGKLFDIQATTKIVKEIFLM